MRFKKSFGQNFLRDKRFIYKIVSFLRPDNDTIIEIGPGSGQITRHLLNKTKKLYCIEKDTRLVNILKERFTPSEIKRFSQDNLFPTTSLRDKSLTGFTSKSVNPALPAKARGFGKKYPNTTLHPRSKERSFTGCVVKFINSDILTFDLSFLKEKSVVFGNVPFNISNHLIKYLVNNRSFIKEGYFTFQKEFAHKLAASCRTKEYGYISCFIQYYADVKLIFDIPKEAFYPVPRVDASFINIKFFDTPQIKVKNEDYLFKLIRSAFSARRKKIMNALSGFGDKEYIRKVLKSINVDGTLRPQDLSLRDYCSICGILGRRVS